MLKYGVETRLKSFVESDCLLGISPRLFKTNGNHSCVVPLAADVFATCSAVKACLFFLTVGTSNVTKSRSNDSSRGDDFRILRVCDIFFVGKISELLDGTEGFMWSLHKFAHLKATRWVRQDGVSGEF